MKSGLYKSGVGLAVITVITVVVISIAYKSKALGIVNTPGPVTQQLSPAGGATAKGSFKGKLKLAGDTGTLGGGGCLVFQDVRGEQPACHIDADCPGNIGTTLAGDSSLDVYGYCVAEPHGTPGSCWYKPIAGPDHCLRGVDIYKKGYDLGPVNAFPLGSDHATRWRVLTCQNLKPMGCAAGIEGDAKRTRYGPIREFPAQ